METWQDVHALQQLLWGKDVFIQWMQRYAHVLTRCLLPCTVVTGGVAFAVTFGRSMQTPDVDAVLCGPLQGPAQNRVWVMRHAVLLARALEQTMRAEADEADAWNWFEHVHRHDAYDDVELRQGHILRWIPMGDPMAPVAAVVVVANEAYMNKIVVLVKKKTVHRLLEIRVPSFVRRDALHVDATLIEGVMYQTLQSQRESAQVTWNCRMAKLIKLQTRRAHANLLERQELLRQQYESQTKIERLGERLRILSQDMHTPKRHDRVASALARDAAEIARRRVDSFGQEITSVIMNQVMEIIDRQMRRLDVILWSEAERCRQLAQDQVEDQKDRVAFVHLQEEDERSSRIMQESVVSVRFVPVPFVPWPRESDLVPRGHTRDVDRAEEQARFERTWTDEEIRASPIQTERLTDAVPVSRTPITATHLAMASALLRAKRVLSIVAYRLGASLQHTWLLLAEVFGDAPAGPDPALDALHERFDPLMRDASFLHQHRTVIEALLLSVRALEYDPNDPVLSQLEPIHLPCEEQPTMMFAASVANAMTQWCHGLCLHHMSVTQRTLKNHAESLLHRKKKLHLHHATPAFFEAEVERHFPGRWDHVAALYSFAGLLPDTHIDQFLAMPTPLFLAMVLVSYVTQTKLKWMSRLVHMQQMFLSFLDFQLAGLRAVHKAAAAQQFLTMSYPAYVQHTAAIRQQFVALDTEMARHQDWIQVDAPMRTNWPKDVSHAINILKPLDVFHYAIDGKMAVLVQAPFELQIVDICQMMRHVGRNVTFAQYKKMMMQRSSYS